MMVEEPNFRQDQSPTKNWRGGGTRAGATVEVLKDISLEAEAEVREAVEVVSGERGGGLGNR